MSITSQCFTEIAKCKITQTMSHDGSGTLISSAKKLCKTQTESPITEVPNAGGVRGRLETGAVAAHYRFLMQSVVNLVWFASL